LGGGSERKTDSQASGFGRREHKPQRDRTLWFRKGFHDLPVICGNSSEILRRSMTELENGK